MKMFTSQIDGHTQLRLSFCLRMVMTMTFALVFLSIGLAQGVPEAGIMTLTCEDLEKPIEIKGEYRLIENCPVDNLKNGIVISANEVHLDMGGHTIAGPIRTAEDCELLASEHPGENPNGIEVTGSNVEIKNGVVIGFDRGILFQRGHNNHAHDLTVTANCSVGIFVLSSDRNHIDGNNVSGTFGTVSGELGHGVQLSTANNNWVNSNVVNSNGAFGVILGDANGNLISSNEILVNGRSGIFLSESNDNFILENKVNGNSFLRHMDNGGGIYVFVDPNNPESKGNFILYNTSKFNHGFDLADLNLTDNPLNCVNFWRSNTFDTDNEDESQGPDCIR